MLNANLFCSLSVFCALHLSSTSIKPSHLLAGSTIAQRSQQLVGCCSNNNMSSQRLIATEQPFIEDVLDKYINSHSNAVEDLTMLALGR